MHICATDQIKQSQFKKYLPYLAFYKAMGVASQAEDFTLFSILVLPTN
jgi:hypothetical protein